MIRMAALAAMLCLGACQTYQEGVQPSPPNPAPSATPKTESKRTKLPAWATEELPEDKPREWSSKEAVNLACRRLNIIRHANCINVERKAYDAGKPANPAKCKFDLNQGCDHK